MRRKLTIGLLLAVLVGVLPLVSFAADEEIVIIGHKSAVDSLSKEDIKQIYLGQKTRWKDETKISFVVLKDKKPYKKFLKKYVRKTLSQYRSYWKMKVFNGTGRMPTSFKHEADLIEYVANTEGAIGFVLSTGIDESRVKIITVN